MRPKQLIRILETMPDEDIRLITDPDNDEQNFWLSRVEFSEKGESGYEIGGEVRFIGVE